MSSRPGIALVLVLALVFVLDLLVCGLLTIATREREIADARARWAEADLQADARLRWAQRNWPAVRRGTQTHFRIDTAADGLFLLRPARGQRGEAGLVVRTLPLRSLLAAFSAGITTDGPLMLAGRSVIDVATLRSPQCESDSIPQRSGPGIALQPGLPVVLPGSTVAAQPVVTNHVAAPLPAAIIDTLQALADHVAAGTVSFERVPKGQACGSGNPRTWDGSVETVRLCSGDFPLALVDALVLSGEFHGVLLVKGTLRLLGDARVTGAIVLAGGRLIAEPGAQVIGAIRGSGAGPILLSAAHLRFDACAVWTALISSDALNRPWPTTRAWVPVF